jgi:fatty acid desaturase
LDEFVAPGAGRLIPRETLRRLSVRSNARGAVQASSHLGAIGLTTAAILATPVEALWLLAPLLFVQGVLINCLYAGLHELSHWTAFRTKPLNDAFGHLFGFATLNPFLTDRWMHFAHHRSTHDPQRDPELMGLPAYTKASYLLDLASIDFWRRRVLAIALASAGRGPAIGYWLGEDERRVVVREARIHMALWALIAAASVALQSWAAVLFWLGPLLATKWVHQLQNTGEHTGLPDVRDIFENTRTLRGPAPVRWLVWNMSYHTAHHAYPGVPFHALPRLHAAVLAARPQGVPTLGYIEAQRAILASLPTRRRLAAAA